MIARLPGGDDAPLGDAITLAVWTLLALAAVLFVLRVPAARRGTWLLVALACTVVALDKAVDLQSLAYEVVRGGAHLLEAVLGARAQHAAVKAAILLGMTGCGVAAAVWWVRRDRPLDRPRWSAVCGLLLVVVYVGVRFLPGCASLAEEWVGWLVEAVAVALVASGIASAWRTAATEVRSSRMS